MLVCAVIKRLRRVCSHPSRAPLADMSPYELSYAAPDDPLFRRLLIRMIEDLSGRRRLLPIYREWSAKIAGKHPLMWSTVLDMIGTRLDVKAPPDWHLRAPAGPLVMIANHPFGIADGIAILALAERLGRPYRILVNADFMRVPEVQRLGLPIDFSETRAALATNLATRAEARRLLKAGVTIVIFPAGGVATAESPFGVAEELPWKQFVVRLIQQSEAAVLPVHFEGQNSPLFHFISRYSLTLRLALLVSEFRHRLGAPIQATVGEPVSSAALAADGHALIDALYLAVHRLAPGAAERDRAALLPRPPQQRRRYPWDAPRAVTPRAEPSIKSGKP
jgi:putative hemolysin